MEKIPVWINAILNEDGHMLSSGSVRTLKMIRDEHSKALSDANKEKADSPPEGQDERKGVLPKNCIDKKRGRNDNCKYPIGSCELCQNNF